MKTIFTSVAAIALALVGCIDQPAPGIDRHEIARRGAAPGSGGVIVRSWSDRTLPLWPNTASAGTITAGAAESGHFLAFGIDAEAGELLWAYSVPRDQFPDFMAENGFEWTTISTHIPDFNHFGGGSIDKPIPGPPPIGDEVTPELATVLVDLGIAHDQLARSLHP
ncbi:MAG TPA: hypothetical protein VKZ63_21800 [Kofleriaceae bacterium]|nr:hypothetical protein [Kofleriaceae bacterium]